MDRSFEPLERTRALLQSRAAKMVEVDRGLTGEMVLGLGVGEESTKKPYPKHDLSGTAIGLPRCLARGGWGGQ